MEWKHPIKLCGINIIQTKFQACSFDVTGQAKNSGVVDPLPNLLCVRKACAIYFLLTQGIGMRVTTQQGIHKFDPAKISADRNIFQRTFVLVRLLGGIPRAFFLFPGNPGFRRCQIDIHVGPV
jgi:hypothetical protein